METIMQYIPLAVSAILLAALILTVITNIITQVVKKITWDNIPTNILAVVVAMAVTLVAFCGVPDHGVGRHLVHGGWSGGPGPVRGLCGYVRIRQTAGGPGADHELEQKQNGVRGTPGTV